MEHRNIRSREFGGVLRGACLDKETMIERRDGLLVLLLRFSLLELITGVIVTYSYREPRSGAAIIHSDKPKLTLVEYLFYLYMAAHSMQKVRTPSRGDVSISGSWPPIKKAFFTAVARRPPVTMSRTGISSSHS